MHLEVIVCLVIAGFLNYLAGELSGYIRRNQSVKDFWLLTALFLGCATFLPLSSFFWKEEGDHEIECLIVRGLAGALTAGQLGVYLLSENIPLVVLACILSLHFLGCFRLEIQNAILFPFRKLAIVLKLKQKSF